MVHWVRHMKHVSIFVRDCAHLTTRLVLHLEISLGTKTQRRESRLLNPTRLSVSVPTNAVLTIFVFVEQDCVETRAQLLVDRCISQPG